MVKQSLSIPDKLKILITKETVDWNLVLKEVLALFECSTGTLHFLNHSNNMLELETQIGIPEFLIPKLSTIPIGKGMAGIAAERLKPVEMCNLQTDDSGVARPAAKETKVEGSLAAPLIYEGKLYGTIGIAKPVPYDFTEKEIETLMNIGNKICQEIG
ncbi:GAF domain-containing protein [Maribacter sp. CXY002]|uniref:GAF domain-containing protein n=1 Tax=Maribacter luteocoastalis TaxID=3407671 RepID=UPI003B66DEA8